MLNTRDCCEDFLLEEFGVKCDGCPKLQNTIAATATLTPDQWRTSKDAAMSQPAKEQTFDEYIKEARDEFVKKFYDFHPFRHNSKREEVWAENIIIAYDQLKGKLAEANEKLNKISKLLNQP